MSGENGIKVDKDEFEDILAAFEARRKENAESDSDSEELYKAGSYYDYIVEQDAKVLKEKNEQEKNKSGETNAKNSDLVTAVKKEDQQKLLDHFAGEKNFDDIFCEKLNNNDRTFRNSGGTSNGRSGNIGKSRWTEENEENYPSHNPNKKLKGSLNKGIEGKDGQISSIFGLFNNDEESDKENIQKNNRAKNSSKNKSMKKGKQNDPKSKGKNAKIPEQEQQDDFLSKLMKNNKKYKLDSEQIYDKDKKIV